jgi:hypothetical protein
VADSFDDMVSSVKARLLQKMLCELQTGGGHSCSSLHLQGHSHQRRDLVASIHAGIERLKQLKVGAAARVAKRLARPNLRVVDVGAGKAPWTIAIATRNASISVTAIDRPERMGELQRAVTAAGLERQFTLEAMDVFQSTIRGEYDLAVLGNVCHLFNEFRNGQLLGRVRTCLHDEGTMAIIDQVLDDDPDWTRWGALYVTGALHTAPGGHVFDFKTYAEWLRKEGACTISLYPICPLPPLSLIVACLGEEGASRAGGQPLGGSTSKI